MSVEFKGIIPPEEAAKLKGDPGEVPPALEAQVQSNTKRIEALEGGEPPDPPDPPPGDAIEPTGTAMTDSDNFKKAIAKGPALLAAGIWNLSMVGPSVLSEGRDLHIEGVGGLAVLDFGHQHLGSMYSLASNTSVMLDSIHVKGCDRFMSATEDQNVTGYRSYKSDEAFWWEDHGAPPALGEGSIHNVMIHDCEFDCIPFMMLTGGGGWSGGFDPNHANPGIDHISIKRNKVRFGGFDFGAVRFGDSEFEENQFWNNITKQGIDDFYRPFTEGSRRWPSGTGLTKSGKPMQAGLRNCIRLGRNQEHYLSTNGECRTANNMIHWIIADIVPVKSKRDSKNDMHGINIRNASVWRFLDDRVDNCLDLYWAHDPAAAADPDVKGVLDAEPCYCKVLAKGRGLKANKFGPCEGAFAMKPARPGSEIRDVVWTRGIVPVPDFALPLLAKMPHASAKSNRITSTPDAVPNAGYSILTSGPEVIYDGVDCRGFVNAEGSVNAWGSRVFPTNLRIFDEDGELTFSN